MAIEYRYNDIELFGMQKLSFVVESKDQRTTQEFSNQDFFVSHLIFKTF